MRKVFRLGLVLLMLLGGSGTAWALEEFRTVVLQSAAGATGNGTAIDTPNYTSIALQVVISNTATVTFEGTVDGTNYVSAVCTSTASTSATLVTTATASGMYQCPVAGFAKFRARVSAWTSGTVTVTARVTTAVLGKKGGGSGGTGASVSDHFVTTTDDTGDIANSFNLGGLTTGILKHSVAAGVSTPATAAAGTDYISPAGVETFATGTKTVTSKFDFGGGTLEIPNSTSLPGTCVVGEAYMDTNATSGQRLYLCESANTWALQGDGTGGLTTHNLLGPTHSDTVAASPVLGDMTVGNVSSLWTVLAGSTSATQKCFKQTGTGAASALPVWDGCGNVNAQTGTTYTVLAADNTKLVTHTNGSAIAVTLPQAGGTGFAAGFYYHEANTGAGTVTITPTTSTINGSATFALTTDQSVCIFSDGTNYKVGCRGTGGAGGGGSSSAQYLQLATDGTNSAERVFTPRDHLSATDGGANGNYTLDWTPNAQCTGTQCTDSIWIKEEFFTGLSTSGNIGTHGWIGSNIAGTSTFQRASGAYPNLGVFQVVSDSAAQGNGGWLSLNDDVNGYGALGDLKTNTAWELNWVFQLSATTAIRARVGVAKNVTNLLVPTDGLWVRFDKNASFADTNFQFECRQASTSTVTDSTIAGDTAWHRIRIWSTTANQINFELYDATGAIQKQSLNICSTNAPTADVLPVAIIGTDTTAAKNIKVDLFSFKIRGLAR